MSAELDAARAALDKARAGTNTNPQYMPSLMLAEALAMVACAAALERIADHLDTGDRLF